MLNFCSLYSGSSGNCLFVESQSTKILVDCGNSRKKVCDGLTSIDKNIEDIDAIIVTHEHSDHIQSLGSISKKYNIPVYANFETWQAMQTQANKISKENQKFFENENNFEIGNLLIHPFSTPHDAANPCGFNIYSGKKKLSIATDLGHMDNIILENLKNSSFILLEANYDPEILKVSKYPFLLKQRIAGPKGHLSNSTAGKTIGYLMQKDLKTVMLGHLSKENNFPELAYQTVAEELMEQNIDMNEISLSVANRFSPSNLINVK